MADLLPSDYLTDIKNGYDVIASVNNIIEAIRSTNSTAANNPTLPAVAGSMYFDLKTAPIVNLKLYDGANWVTLFTFTVGGNNPSLGAVIRSGNSANDKTIGSGEQITLAEQTSQSIRLTSSSPVDLNVIPFIIPPNFPDRARITLIGTSYTFTQKIFRNDTINGVILDAAELILTQYATLELLWIAAEQRFVQVNFQKFV